MFKKIILFGLFFILLAFSVCADVFDINEFKFSSEGEDDEVKPGEILDVSFYVENAADDDLEDVEVNVWFEDDGDVLEDEDEKDLEDDKTIGDLDSGEDERVDFSFRIPWNAEDGDDYDFVIEITADNASNNQQLTYEDSSESIIVEKEKHDIVFYKADFFPDSIKCNREVSLKIGMINIGRENEENVGLSIKHDGLGIDVQENVSMDKDYGDKTNKINRVYDFSVPMTLAAGIYAITPRAEYGGVINDKTTIRIEVQNCPSYQPEEDEEEEQEEETKEEEETSGVTTTQETGTQEEKESTSTKTTTGYQRTVSAKKSVFSNTLLIILIISAVVLLAVVITLLVLILRRR